SVTAANRSRLVVDPICPLLPMYAALRRVGRTVRFTTDWREEGNPHRFVSIWRSRTYHGGSLRSVMVCRSGGHEGMMLVACGGVCVHTDRETSYSGSRLRV